MNILMIAVVPYFTDHHREVLTPHTMGWKCFGRNVQIFIHLHSIHATLSAKIVENSHKWMPMASNILPLQL